MRRKLNKREVLKYLTEYLIQTLNELKNFSSLSSFSEGELLAYIECLEIISLWSGFKKYGITDIEAHFNVH